MARGNFKKCRVLLGSNTNEGHYFIIYFLTNIFKKQVRLFLGSPDIEPIRLMLLKNAKVSYQPTVTAGSFITARSMIKMLRICFCKVTPGARGCWITQPGPHFFGHAL